MDVSSCLSPPTNRFPPLETSVHFTPFPSAVLPHFGHHPILRLERHSPVSRLVLRRPRSPLPDPNGRFQLDTGVLESRPFCAFRGNGYNPRRVRNGLVCDRSRDGSSLGLLHLDRELLSACYKGGPEAGRTTVGADPIRPNRARSMPNRVKAAAVRPAATSGICLIA